MLSIPEYSLQLKMFKELPYLKENETVKKTKQKTKNKKTEFQILISCPVHHTHSINQFKMENSKKIIYFFKTV